MLIENQKFFNIKGRLYTYYLCEDCNKKIPIRKDHIKDRQSKYCVSCYAKRNARVGYEYWRGKKHTKIAIERMSKPRNKVWKNPHSIETNKKISITLQNKWKDPNFRKQQAKNLGILLERIKLEGKCEYDYPPQFNKYLRRLIRERDNFTCKECGYTEDQLGYNLSIHHIDYNKKNYDFTNLISLCKSCHAQTNFDRKDWEKYFKER